MARKGQKEKILDHLERYGTISTYEAFKLYGVTRISNRIGELEEDGIRIDSVWEKSKNGTTYKRYMLHYITCTKCGETFSRDETEEVKGKSKCPHCGHINVTNFRGQL